MENQTLTENQNEGSATAKTRDALVKDVENLKKNAAQVVQDVREHANAHVDETKKRVTDTIQGMQKSMTTHPVALLGIGLLIGFLFGRRFTR